MNEQNKTEQKKNELGHIYGSRISKNGNWLNLLIVSNINGQEVRLTCPVRIAEDEDDFPTDKPRAVIEKACNADGFHYSDKARLVNIPVYADNKPSEAQAAAEDDGLPF